MRHQFYSRWFNSQSSCGFSPRSVNVLAGLLIGNLTCALDTAKVDDHNKYVLRSGQHNFVKLILSNRSFTVVISGLKGFNDGHTDR